MGCIQTKKQSKPLQIQKQLDLTKQLECPICLQMYDRSHKIPKIIGCGHIICQECINQIQQNSQLTCPFDRKIFKNEFPNSLLTLELLDKYEEQQNVNNSLKIPQNEKKNKNIDFQQQITDQNKKKERVQNEFLIIQQRQNNYLEKNQEQKCPNNHYLVWNSWNKTCFLCNTYSHGMLCDLCNYQICSKCAGLKTKNPPTITQCPNNHNLFWNSRNKTCFFCNTYSHGMLCDLCNYQICSKCAGLKTKNPTTITQCPNNHNLVWNSRNRTCFLCNTYSHGMLCDYCDYIVCSKCAGLKTKSPNTTTQCPNNHNLVWNSRNRTCFLCNTYSHGMLCDYCDYIVCSKCAGLKTKNHTTTTQCPNNHYLVWNSRNKTCFLCNTYSHGMLCDLCDYQICSKCAGIKKQFN